MPGGRLPGRRQHRTAPVPVKRTIVPMWSLDRAAAGSDRMRRQIVTETPGDAMTEQPADPIAEHRFAKLCGGPPKRVSVIYPHHDRPEVLLRSLERLWRQDWAECRPEEMEVIVVDDGSPAAAAQTLVEALPEQVLYLRQRRNGFGASRARNTGARLATGRYLIFLDPDILVGPSHLDRALRLFRRHGDRTVLAGHVSDYYYAGSPDPRRQFGVWEHPDRPTRRFFQLASGNMAIARSLFLESPGFDEDLIYGEMEDTLFGWQLGRLPGTAILFSTALGAEHVPHPPGPAHGDGERTRAILKRKWPDFHRDYVELGLR